MEVWHTLGKNKIYKSHDFRNRIGLVGSIRNQTFNQSNKNHKIGDSTLKTVGKN